VIKRATIPNLAIERVEPLAVLLGQAAQRAALRRREVRLELGAALAVVLVHVQPERAREHRLLRLALRRELVAVLAHVRLPAQRGGTRRARAAKEETHHHRNVGFSIINPILGLVGR
jgi:hypothetical protein